jgi:AcrR family transcriptional regulator
MSTSEHKEREEQQRRETILDAAEVEIFSKGLDQATMDEIADRAQLSKGTLYLYFRNKNELYMGICERGSSELNRRFSKVLTSDRPGIELIGKLGETYIDFVRENPDYFKSFLYYESFEDADELKESDVANKCEENIREAFTYTVRALQIGMQDGSIENGRDPRKLALIIWGATRGIIKLSFMKESGQKMKVLREMDIDVKELFDRFRDIVVKGIAANSKD